MKYFFSILITVLVGLGAHASTIDEIEMSTKGQTLLGVGVGVPPFSEGADANLPCLSVNFSAGLISGFVNTPLFGRNGAVDVGLNYAVCHYGNKFGLYNTCQEVKVFQNTLVARSAFHFQFVNSLDTYAGVCVGVNICSESFLERTTYSEASVFEQWDHIEKNTFSPVLGVYLGVKWFFSEKFALGFDFANDFLRTDDEACEEAYNYSHYGGSALPVVSIVASLRLGKK